MLWYQIFEILYTSISPDVFSDLLDTNKSCVYNNVENTYLFYD